MKGTGININRDGKQKAQVWKGVSTANDSSWWSNLLRVSFKFLVSDWCQRNKGDHTQDNGEKKAEKA